VWRTNLRLRSICSSIENASWQPGAAARRTQRHRDAFASLRRPALGATCATSSAMAAATTVRELSQDDVLADFFELLGEIECGSSFDSDDLEHRRWLERLIKGRVVLGIRAFGLYSLERKPAGIWSTCASYSRTARPSHIRSPDRQLWTVARKARLDSCRVLLDECAAPSARVSSVGC
jgi:hypothetical protein